MHKIIFIYFRWGLDLIQLKLLENEYGMLFKQVSKDNNDVLIDAEGNCFVMPIKMGNKSPRWFTINYLHHKTFKSVEINSLNPNHFEVMHIGHQDLNSKLEFEQGGQFKENSLHVWRSNVTDSSYQEMFFQDFFSKTANDYQNQFNKYYGIIGKEE